MRGSTFDLIVLWAAVVGQVLFVLLWATQRWWASTVGQALMAKSASLALILVASLWSYYRGPLPLYVGRGLFLAVALAIVAQLFALLWELRRARRERQPKP
jgi:hypothetical protein